MLESSEKDTVRLGAMICKLPLIRPTTKASNPLMFGLMD
jgi:hypothetical protein